MDAMSDFKLAVDESNKATELPLLRVCGTVQQNPHMRAFWAATISFFLAFLGWFALAPLGLEVATSMGTCENQLYPPESSPTRVACLKYKNISTTETYCQYGQVKAEDGTLTDCEEVPAGIASSPTATAEEKMKYRPQVLAKCVCTTGTECNGIIAFGSGSCSLHNLCSHCSWHSSGEVWSCECAVGFDDLRGDLGCLGFHNSGTMAILCDPVLHQECLYWLSCLAILEPLGTYDG